MGVMISILFTFLLIMHLSSGIHILELLADYGLKNTYGIETRLLPRFAEYDFIIIGSGPGGSPVANRLSENKNWKVLLLEAGKPEGILHQVPMLANHFLNSEYDWQYRTEPQKKACLGRIDQRCGYPKGKALGGSSSINGMGYSRGNKLDFDRWAKQGNYGWSYKEVLPYFRKSERAQLREPVDESYHGKNGYVHVQNAPCHSALAAAFLESGKEMGFDVIDYNGRQQIGFSYHHLTMLNGTRCSASKAYLRVKRENLDIVTEARVSRILIDIDHRVYGVEFVKSNKSYRINVSKEVILSAGTIDTPKLLMLSGIGPKEHLDELGIKVIKNAKVGYNFQDHVGFVGLTFLVNQSVSLIPKNMQRPEIVLQYAIKGTGPYSISSASEALAFSYTKYATDDRPDLELLFRAAATEPSMEKDTYTIIPAAQMTRSKGRLKLRSNNFEDHPVIDANLLDDGNDVEILVEGIKLAIEVSKSEAFQRYGSQLYDINISACEEFKFAFDDYWRCAIRHMAIPFSHEMGTAKMGPSTDSDAVVDPELRVYGVKGLRIIDASIMPDIPVGHLAATIYMIAEKGADMIKQSW
ncbi:glucose dehydrogenase [FAD, quinone] [Diachasma alloeum]|uniref:glucose dehydrogenase [FAD, quinone] n=1 Tax=Diachasma alloeum TaxID=454923 RepID=UPI0007384308|nr:glucose dehydrogenase [FAD, quinone] [Diachasma alloeum]